MLRSVEYIKLTTFKYLDVKKQIYECGNDKIRREKSGDLKEE